VAGIIVGDGISLQTGAGLLISTLSECCS